jgi:hypothetical protein
VSAGCVGGSPKPLRDGFESLHPCWSSIEGESIAVYLDLAEMSELIARLLSHSIAGVATGIYWAVVCWQASDALNVASVGSIPARPAE